MTVGDFVHFWSQQDVKQDIDLRRKNVDMSV